MNQRTPLAMLFLLLLAIGPYLFAIPLANACPPPPPDVVVSVEGAPDIVVDVEPRSFPDFPAIPGSLTYEISIELIGKINGEIPVVSIQILIPAGVDPDNPSQIVIAHYYLLGDVNGDYKVNGQDIKLIANANKNRIYIWQYDLDLDGYIDEEDIHIANSHKGEQATWNILPTTIVQTASGRFVAIAEDVPHVSGWGIRR